MKNKAIELLDGGLETYLLALYGLTLPNMHIRKCQKSKYAPIMGLFGASVELIIKSCLVQGKGLEVMYKNNDLKSGVYKFGTDVLKEFKTSIKNKSKEITFIWKNPDDYEKQQTKLIFYLNKFRLLQDLRAQGLHAGIGCSRDIAVSTGKDVYDFIMLLAQGKRLKAYIKNIPAPEDTIKDREALIEDLSRRLNMKRNVNEKIGYLRNMYLVLPYIPEIPPDWIDQFENLSITPPKVDDVNYLAQTLFDAHNIYFLKNRGGKEGISVKYDPDNPGAIPIGVQYLKRELSTIPEVFHESILTANSWLKKNRIGGLPIEDFLVDLFIVGLKKAGVLLDNVKLTAQQVWPFVVSAYSTQGTPRPCMEFLRNCDELLKLKSFLVKAKKIGNGYFKRRSDSIIQLIEAIESHETVSFEEAKDRIFKEIKPFKKQADQHIINNPFTLQYIRKNTFSSETREILEKYIHKSLSAGTALEEILKQEEINDGDRKAIAQFIKLCVSYDDRSGLVAVLRNEKLKGYVSQVRKRMFLIDFVHFYRDEID